MGIQNPRGWQTSGTLANPDQRLQRYPWDVLRQQAKWEVLAAQSRPELKVSSCFLFQLFLLPLLLYTGDPPNVRHGAALHLHGQTGLGSHSQVGQSVWPWLWQLTAVLDTVLYTVPYTVWSTTVHCTVLYTVIFTVLDTTVHGQVSNGLVGLEKVQPRPAS